MKNNFVYHRWTLDKQLVFLKRLEYLIANGHSLSNAIRLLSKFYKGFYLSDILNIDRYLREGKTLSEIFSILKFKSEIITLFYLTNENSSLSGLLNKSSLILEQKLRIQKLLIKTLTYPSFLLLFTLLIINFFNSFLLPQYQTIFTEFNSNKPNSLILLVSIINSTPYLIFIILFSAFNLFIISRWTKLRNVYLKIYRFILLIPILGAILKKRNSYIFSLLVSTFLDKGISLYESFEILKKSQDVSISIFSIEIIKSFKEGVNLPNAFLKTHIFEINLIEVIQTSQISGEIAKQLNGYSVFCVEELELLIKKLFVICQTIIYLFVLLLIIVTYISILTPLYSMINNF